MTDDPEDLINADRSFDENVANVMEILGYDEFKARQVVLIAFNVGGRDRIIDDSNTDE